MLGRLSATSARPPVPGAASTSPGTANASTPPGGSAAATLTPAELDDDSLNALRNLAADGDEAFFQELVDLFLADALVRVNDLDRTLATGQAGDFTRAAHSIKGACANFGATELGHISEEIETFGRVGNLPGAAPCLPRLRLELARVRLALMAETGR